MTIDLSALANIATALTVIVAAAFGVVELRRARREREERAAFAVVRAIMTPEWIRSVILAQSLPEDAAPEDVTRDPRVLDAVQSVGIILEALGYAVFAHVVPLRVVDELVGGTVRVTWRKSRRYVEAERRQSGSQKSWEWFQWLAEQLETHAPARTSLSTGAYEAYRAWRP